MNLWAIILAAGKGSRMSAVLPDTGLGALKQFLRYKDAPLFWHSARAFSRYAGLSGLVFVFPAIMNEPESASLARYEDLVRDLERREGNSLGLPWKIALGGERRQDSVRLALTALPPLCEGVLIHDAARPFVSTSLVAKVSEALVTGAAGVVPGVPVTDTIKVITPEHMVGQTPDRDMLRAVQTPQGFRLAALCPAHQRAEAENWTVTDDAALLEHCGIPVLVVEGQMDNVKITNPEDLALLARETQTTVPCAGFGYDVHRYGGNRPFILGGVPIATDIMVDAHSDGDTLLHALMDAMLGCVGLGDIGGLFPDTDARFENISSGILLAEVRDRCLKAGLAITNVDITVIAQAPRIAPHRDNIAANLAKMLHLPLSAVNVKATTEERLGFTGEKKGLKVTAVVSGLRPANIG